jgi:CRP-like cAMP-binding protein
MIKLILGWLKSLLHKPSKYASLRRYSIFKHLDSFELYLLNNFMHQRSFKQGEQLFDVGYPLEVVFFIEKGEIEVIGKANPHGRALLSKNQWIGIMDMFYENIRSSSAKALTDVQVLAISRDDLMDLINKNPHMGLKILSGICESLSRYVFTLCDSFSAQATINHTITDINEGK